MDAENTYQVFDWLWTSGQLTEQDINTLPKYGIRTVINLLHRPIRRMHCVVKVK